MHYIPTEYCTLFFQQTSSYVTWLKMLQQHSLTEKLVARAEEVYATLSNSEVFQLYSLVGSPQHSRMEHNRVILA